jgi:hypothetical protein
MGSITTDIAKTTHNPFGIGQYSVTLTGSPTMGDYFDQAVKTTSNVAFTKLAVGTGSPTSWTLESYKTTDIVSGSGPATPDLSHYNTQRSQLIITPGAAKTYADLEALYGVLNYQSNYALTNSYIVGVHGDVALSGSGNIGPQMIAGLWGTATYAGTGTSIDMLMGVRGELTVDSGTGVKLASLYAAMPELNGGTTSNAYGLYIEDIYGTGSIHPTTTYAIYSAGNITSLFSGLINISTTNWTKFMLTETGTAAQTRMASDSTGNMTLSANAYWSGSAWVRDDIAKPSFAFMEHAGNNQYEFRIAAAASGNITWLTPLKITTTGLINVTTASTFGLIDTDSSHYLRLNCGSDLTADRILTFTTGDAARTITLSGNPTLNDWFDQAVKTTSTGVVFAGLAVTNAASTHIDMNVGATGRAAQIHYNRGTGADSYVGPSAANVFDIWCVENIDLQIAVNNAEQFRITSSATHVNGQLQVDHIGQHTGFHRTVIDNGLDIAAGQTLKADHIAELTGSHTVTFDNDITRVGKLYIDHIGEATGSHSIILDNDISRVGKVSVDHIAEATGSHKIIFDNDLSRVGKISIDHIGEATGSHNVVFDNTVQVGSLDGLILGTSGVLSASIATQPFSNMINVAGGLGMKGPSVYSSFSGTVSSTGSRVTFSSEADAILAGYHATSSLRVVGSQIVASSFTATVSYWANSTGAEVIKSPSPEWSAGTTITSIGRPIQFSVDASGNLKHAVCYDGSVVINDTQTGLVVSDSKFVNHLDYGAANKHLVMNAGATLPEWATIVCSGGWTYDLTTASGTQNVGCSFKAAHYLFLAGIWATNGYCIGFDDGASTVYHDLVTPDGRQLITGGGYSIGYIDDALSNYQVGYISAKTDSTFTITWTKTGSPTGTLTILYLAFR